MAGVKEKSGGRRNGSGRKKGGQNKITADIKAMVLGALEAKGGQEYLEQQADLNPVAFMALLGKILPTQITGDQENPIVVQQIIRRIVDASGQ